MGYPTQLHQVVLNLCTNAAHAMQKDGGTLTLRLKDKNIDADAAVRHTDIKPGKHIHIIVKDTGHGISPDLMERIFDPFFTTKNKGEGTGLGLAVVHGIIK